MRNGKTSFNFQEEDKIRKLYLNTRSFTDTAEFMAEQLLIVPSRLQFLSAKLRRDRDVQTQINDITRKARTAARSFQTALSKEGCKVLLQKTLLITASPDDISISDIQSALYSAIEAFSATKKLIVCLQTDIHSSIEICRERKVHHESELADILTRITIMWSEIENLELTITTYEDQATALFVEAVELNKRAEDVKKDAKEKRQNVETTGIIGGIVGVALAPFTGGASLALAAAATGISAAVNLTGADDCDKAATRLRSDADRKQERAKKLKSQKKQLLKQRSSLESEMRTVQSKTERLTEAANVLQQVTSFLLPSIDAIDVLIHTFQDLDTAIKEVLLKNNSFEIFRSAFANQTDSPHKGSKKYMDMLKDLDTAIKEVLLKNNSFEIFRSAFANQTDSPHKGSKKYMDMLKEKWEQLEGILLQHGAQNMEI